MCWQCDNPGRTTEDFLAEVVVPEIDRYGWFVQAVLGSRASAPFAYTVGLTEVGLPELVVTGLPHHRSEPIVHAMAERWLHTDVHPGHGEHVDTRDGVCLEVVGLPHPEAHLLLATALYGEHAVAAQQLVWPDARGRWPWDRAHRAGRGGQPVLGPRAPERRGSCARTVPGASPGGGGGGGDGAAG